MSDVTFTDKNFQEEVLKASGIVLVDFFATWCGPCKMMAPIIDRLAEAYKGKVKMGKLDVEESPETAGKYGVQSVPTIIIFKDGEVVDSSIGFQSEEALRKKLDTL